MLVELSLEISDRQTVILADCQRPVCARWQSGDIAICTLQIAGASIPTVSMHLGGGSVHGGSPWFQSLKTTVQSAGSQQSHGRRRTQTTELTETNHIATQCSVETAGR